jgi:hypothetical protein
LNKPVYYANAKQNFQGDSTIFQDEIYTIKSKAAFIKEVTINRTEGEIFMLSINLAKDNLISSTSIKLFYNTVYVPYFVHSSEPEIRYSIQGVQTLKGLNQTNVFEVEGIISNRD